MPGRRYYFFNDCMHTYVKSLGLAASAAVLGAATWAAWLSWGFYPQRAYSPTQVIACAGTALVLVTLLTWLAPWARPVITIPLPFAVGMSIVWTIWAASDDDSGLFAVGSLMMLVGVTCSLTFVEWLARVVFPRSRG